MPEGHLLHRYAGQLTDELAGRAVVASSPQGRFAADAVDGLVLDRVEAAGKHLLHRFAAGPWVHVRLGMRGVYLRHDDPSTPPRAGVRLRLAAGTAWDLIAPSVCALLDDDGVAGLLARLGPDPLRGDADDAEAVRRLRASPRPGRRGAARPGGVGRRRQRLAGRAAVRRGPAAVAAVQCAGRRPSRRAVGGDPGAARCRP